MRQYLVENHNWPEILIKKILLLYSFILVFSISASPLKVAEIDKPSNNLQKYDMKVPNYFYGDTDSSPSFLPLATSDKIV